MWMSIISLDVYASVENESKCESDLFPTLPLLVAELLAHLLNG